MSLSNSLENKLMVWAFTDDSAPTRPTSWWVQLHVGDPGEDCTSNVATESTRKECVFTVTDNAADNDADIEWTNVAGSEDYTYVSVWDAETDGNALGSGACTANAVTAGDNFTIQAGDLDISLD